MAFKDYILPAATLTGVLALGTVYYQFTKGVQIDHPSVSKVRVDQQCFGSGDVNTITVFYDDGKECQFKDAKADYVLDANVMTNGNCPNGQVLEQILEKTKGAKK